MKIAKPVVYLPLLVSGALAYAQDTPLIYQWLDEQGRTYYSDQPPPDTPVRALDPNQLSLSTIGGSGLRTGEQELLERYQDAQAQREQAAEQAPTPPAVVVVNPPPEPVVEKRVIWPAWWHSRYRHTQRQRHHSSSRFNLSIQLGPDRTLRPPFKPAKPSFRPSSIRPLKPARKPASKPTNRSVAGFGSSMRKPQPPRSVKPPIKNPNENLVQRTFR